MTKTIIFFSKYPPSQTQNYQISCLAQCKCHMWTGLNRELKRLEPLAWSKLNHLVSDFKHSPKLAYRELEGHDIMYWTGSDIT